MDSCQVDQAKLDATAGCKCTLVKEDQLEAVTGRKVGCVHPFVPGVSRRYIDIRVGSDGGVVSFNTGDMTRGLILTKEGLLSALGDQATIHDIACAEDGEDAANLAHKLGVARNDARFILDTDGALSFYEVTFLWHPALGSVNVLS